MSPGSRPKPDLAQIGPKQAGQQEDKAEHDQKARHRHQSLTGFLRQFSRR